MLHDPQETVKAVAATTLMVWSGLATSPEDEV